MTFDTRSGRATARADVLTLLRSAVFNLYFYGLTVLLCIPGTVIRFVAPRYTLALPMLWARLAVAGLSAICRVRVEVTGRERLPPAAAALIASRHQSAFDTLIWLTLLPRCCYVIKRELKNIPVFGGMMEPAGMILVDRTRGPAAMRHLLREAERAKREERQIVIFPEGTRSAPGVLGSLQPGAAAVAVRTGLPVIPAITDSGHCWGRRSFLKRPGTIRIELLEPISPERGRGPLMRDLEAALQKEFANPVDNSVGVVRRRFADNRRQKQ
ncbi:MAG: 1-acyl-sn-glycerol-3-phosphate acyltransferase [Pseudomonadota bacterium]|nr:1-acyl-sn-glycerol-3-phosphate acyltransferase [Pseudomonadota bacterium]